MRNTMRMMSNIGHRTTTILGQLFRRVLNVVVYNKRDFAQDSKLQRNEGYENSSEANWYQCPEINCLGPQGHGAKQKKKKKKKEIKK